MPVGFLWSSDFWIKRDAAVLRVLIVEGVNDDHSFTHYSLCEIHLGPLKMLHAVFLLV